TETGRQQGDTRTARAFAEIYLSPKHRNDIGHGCPIAGISSEGARATPEIRATLTGAIEREIENFSAASPGATAAQRRRAAIAAYSAMVGAVVLSRIVDDKALSDEILTATRKSLRFT